MTNQPADPSARLRSGWTRARRPLLWSGTAGALVVLAACGSSTATSGNPSPQPTQTSQPRNAQPGAAGKIAEVDAGSIEVQGTDSQTTVSFTASTTITAQVAATASAVAVGSCISVTSDEASGVGGPNASDVSQPITATSVEILPLSSDGTCSFGPGAGGFGGGGFGRTSGARPSGAPTNGFGQGDRSSTRPSTRPSGATGALRGRAIGTVVSVSGTTVIVKEVAFTGRAGSTPSGSPTPTTQSRTVNLTSTTTYQTTQTATSAALIVGKCTVAQGKSDSSGALAATSIAITDPVNGSCSGGFGGGAGRRGANGGNGSSGGAGG